MRVPPLAPSDRNTGSETNGGKGGGDIGTGEEKVDTGGSYEVLLASTAVGLMLSTGKEKQRRTQGIVTVGLKLSTGKVRGAQRRDRKWPQWERLSKMASPNQRRRFRRVIAILDWLERRRIDLDCVGGFRMILEG